MSARPPILVTGAAGFIGAEVCAVLTRAGCRVLGVDDLSAGEAGRLGDLPDDLFELVVGDVRDRALMGALFAERPRAVLHLAARVGVRTVLEDPMGCERENLEGVHVLAEQLRDASGSGCAPRVVAASTSEVYAESSAPLGESAPLRPARAEGRWRYAASKRRAEEILDDARLSRRPLHLRFFNVVGPGQDASSGMVLPRFVEAAREGRPLEVYGSGAQVRTFAHVDAVARDIAALVAPETLAPSCAGILGEASGALNVGGTARTTIAALADLVVRLGESSSEVQRRDPRRAVSANFEEVQQRVPDLARARSLGLASSALGSEPWSLEALVEDTLRRHRSVGAVATESVCASRAS